MLEWKSNLVSVIMPAYNSQALLESSVRSVMAQTYPHWELLIVDDASTDATLAIARELARADERIRLVRMTHNAGVAAARNRGIAEARGQYIAFLDSDDLWLERKLEAQIGFMQSTGTAFSFTKYRRMRRNGTLGRALGVPVTVGYEQLLRGNVIGCLTVIIDRAQVPEIEMPHVKHEDYVTWLGILKRGVVAWSLQQDLARYRVAESSVSSDKKRSAGWTWNIYRQVEKLSIPKAIWCFVHYSLHSIYVRLVY